MTLVSVENVVGVVPAGLRSRITPARRDGIVRIVLLVLTLGMYLHYSLHAGWYYDDWNIYAGIHLTHGGWGAQISSCGGHVPGGRSLVCVYDVTEFDLFQAHYSLYHLVVLVFLVINSWLAYAILKRCRLRWTWAALAAALMIVSPVSDSARLWSIAAIGQPVVALQLTAALVALRGLGLPPGRRQIALHALAALMSLVAMVTYEIAVPLVALNILVYFAAYRNRAAVIRGLIDIGLVILFLIYRTTINPVSAGTSFDVKRSLDAEIDRGWLLLKTAWATWRTAYAPGAALVVLLVVLAASLVVAAARPSARRAVGFWWAIIVGATAVAALCVLTYLTAADLYLPQIFGVFNRVNLPGTLAYAVAFIGVLGLLREIVRCLRAPEIVAITLVTAAVIGVAFHQRAISQQHKASWEASWQQQQTALAGYRIALKGVSHNSRILGFDTPEWEPGWIPVFASTWDLRGALEYETKVDPPFAIPFAQEGPTCGPSGVVLSGQLVTPYRQAGSPLYAVSPKRRLAIHVTSQTKCEQVVKRWGPAPYWAP